MRTCRLRKGQPAAAVSCFVRLRRGTLRCFRVRHSRLGFALAVAFELVRRGLPGAEVDKGREKEKSHCRSRSDEPMVRDRFAGELGRWAPACAGATSRWR